MMRSLGQVKQEHRSQGEPGECWLKSRETQQRSARVQTIDSLNSRSLRIVNSKRARRVDCTSKQQEQKWPEASLTKQLTVHMR